VGTSTSKIYDEAQRLLSDTNEYERMSKAHNPYGDGLASRRIVEYFINNLDISSFE
jgi:UDP-N-acetylglucosamine 2-epimerase (non-hydrolysing)